MSERGDAENGLPAGLLDYFANRQAQESALTDQAWAALTPREQSLVREAAVMGFVRGQFYGTERRTPKDSAIVRDVLTEVRGFADLYPTLNHLTRPTPPTVADTADTERAGGAE
jgi:hypothetical protein